MKRALVLVAVLGLLSLPLVAGEFLMNDSGEIATALRVTFSEPVTITGFGDTLMDVAPAGESAEFTFSGGEVDAWGSHWMNWEPESASLLSVEWLKELIVLPEFNPEEAAVAPHLRQDQFQLVLPEEDGGDIVGVITRTISVEQIPFVVTYVFESDSVDEEVEWTSIHAETSDSPEVVTGASARFVYLSNRHNPEVTAKFSIRGELHVWEDPDISFPLHNMANIKLDAAQFFPEDTVISAEWSATNGDPDDAATFPITSDTAATATLVSQWPNALDVICTGETATGETAEKAVRALIYFQEGCPFPVRGTASSFGPPMREATWSRMLDTMIPLLRRLGMNSILYPINWYYGDPDDTGTFSIEPVYHAPHLEWSIADDPRGATPPEDIVEHVLRTLVDAGLPPFIVFKPVPNQNQPELGDTYDSAGYGEGFGFMHSEGFLYGDGMGYFNYLTHYADLLTEIGVIGVGFGSEQGALVAHGGEPSRSFFSRVADSWREQPFEGLLTYGTIYINRMDVCPNTYCVAPINPTSYEPHTCGIPWDELDAIGLTFYPTLASTHNDTTAQMLLEARRIIATDLRPLSNVWGKPLFILDAIAMEVDGGAVYPVEYAECPTNKCIRDAYEKYDPEEHRRWVTALLRAFSEANTGAEVPLFTGIMIESYSNWPYWFPRSEEDRMYRETHTYLDPDCAELDHQDTLQAFFRDSPATSTSPSSPSRATLAAAREEEDQLSADVFEQELATVLGGLVLGARIQDTMETLNVESLPELIGWTSTAGFTFWLQGPAGSERQTSVDERFHDRGWRVSSLDGGVQETGLMFRIRFESDDHPSMDPGVEYNISIGSVAGISIRPGRPVCAIAALAGGQEVEVVLPYEFYSIDADSIDMFFPSEVLEGIGIAPEKLADEAVRLAVTHRTGDLHAFIYCPGEAVLQIWE